MRPRVNDNDAFLLSRLLDGDLSPAESAALRERIAHDSHLQAEYDAISRVDHVLAARRADQPDVDWDRFHARVVAALERETRGSQRTIKLRRWIQVGVPLAAAAAVALLVTTFRDAGSPPQTPHNASAPIVVALNAPSHSTAGEIRVRVHRPQRAQQGAPVVRFQRSQQLADATLTLDEARRGGPSYVAAMPERVPETAPLMELPPL